MRWAPHFGQYPAVADGIFLRTWRAGPQKSDAKIPPAVRTMMDRGFIEIRQTERGPRAFFTEAGLQELRRLVLDRRYMRAQHCFAERYCATIWVRECVNQDEKL